MLLLIIALLAVITLQALFQHCRNPGLNPDCRKVALENAPKMRIIWALRNGNLSGVFGGSVADQLPARGQLGSDLRKLVESGRVTVEAGFAAEHVDRQRNGVVVSGRGVEGILTLDAVDRIIAATGPDLDMTHELRLDLDLWLGCPRALGPMIDPNLRSCGTVAPHGHKELSYPEPGYDAVGIKSCGRAPTFLMATGYEQVRSIAAHFAGDIATANDIRLMLPETGICSTHFATEDGTRDGCRGGHVPTLAGAGCKDTAAL